MNDSEITGASSRRPANDATQTPMAALIAQDRAEAIEIADPAVLAASPAVSVAMLAYKHGPFVAQAIESIVAQKTDFPFELLIGEDCSPDNTRAVAEEYRQRYPHIIRIVTGPRNIGMMRNHFRMIARVRSDFIAYCEGDDWWTDSKKLQKQFDILDRNKKISICVHAALLFSENAKTHSKKQYSAKRPRTLRLEQVVRGSCGMIPTSSMFLRRSALPPMKEWYINALVGDLPIQMWATTQGACFYHPEIMSAYRVGAPQQWTSQAKSVADLWATRKRLIATLLVIGEELSMSAGDPNVVRMVRKRVGDLVASTLVQSKRAGIYELDNISDYLQFLSPYNRMVIVLERYPWISNSARSIKSRLIRFCGGGSFLAT